MNSTEILRQAGLKATPQRRLVYELLKKNGHTLIEQLIKEVQATAPEITISTIYRILDAFCAKNILKRVSCNNGKTYYDVTICEHCHILTPQQQLIDVCDSELMEYVRGKVSDKLGKDERIENISIQITLKS